MPNTPQDRQAGARKFPATTPMSDDWDGRVETLQLPNGVTKEMVCAGMMLVQEWTESSEPSTAPLVLMLFGLRSSEKIDSSEF